MILIFFWTAPKIRIYKLEIGREKNIKVFLEVRSSAWLKKKSQGPHLNSSNTLGEFSSDLSLQCLVPHERKKPTLPSLFSQ